MRDAIADRLAAPDRLLAALGWNLISGDIDRIIGMARALRTRILDPRGRDPAHTIRPLLHKVMLDEGCVRIRIDRAALQAALGVTADTDQEPHYALEVRARVTTRGERLKLVFEEDRGQARREPDPVLIKTIARAHDWLRRLASGESGSVKDIAAADSVTGSYVTRVLRLAFLAPDIVEAILDGRQPVELTTKRLLLLGDLPLGWQDQRLRLGFTAE